MSNGDQFHLHSWYYPAELGQEYKSIILRITTEPVDVDDKEFQAGTLVSDLGVFDTLSAARQAVKEYAGVYGAAPHYEDFMQDDETCIEAYKQGEYGLLTQWGTWSQYAEWAYDESRDASPDSFDALVDAAYGDAVERCISIPVRQTLRDLLQHYYQGHCECANDAEVSEQTLNDMKVGGRLAASFWCR